MNILKRFSPMLYLVVLIGFFLPFIEISCSSTSLGTFSGYSIMTGSAGESIRNINPQTEPKETPKMNIELLVVFVITIIGLFLAFFRNPKTVILAAITALIGFVFLLIFKSNLDTQIQNANQFMAIVQVHYKTGFWLSLFFLLLALITEMMFFLTQRRNPEKPSDSTMTGIKPEVPPVN